METFVGPKISRRDIEDEESATTTDEDEDDEAITAAEELDCGASLGVTLEDELITTLELEFSSRELEERACNELDDEEAIAELDCGASLGVTLELEFSSRELEERACNELDDVEAIAELDCGASLGMTLEDELITTLEEELTATESAALVSSSNSANKSLTCANAEVDKKRKLKAITIERIGKIYKKSRPKMDGFSFQSLKRN